MKSCFILLYFLLITSFQSGAQNVKFYVEPFVGTHFYHELKSTDVNYKDRGLKTFIGLKSSIVFRDFVSINITRGISSIQYPEMFCQLTGRVSYFQPKPYLSLFVEAGVQLSEFDGFQTPFYLGIINNEGELFSWVTRVKIPTGVDTHLFKMSDTYSFGLEVGLQVRIGRKWQNKPVQRFGNPFILG